MAAGANAVQKMGNGQGISVLQLCAQMAAGASAVKNGKRSRDKRFAAMSPKSRGRIAVQKMGNSQGISALWLFQKLLRS